MFEYPSVQTTWRIFRSLNIGYLTCLSRLEKITGISRTNGRLFFPEPFSQRNHYTRKSIDLSNISFFSPSFCLCTFFRHGCVVVAWRLFRVRTWVMYSNTQRHGTGARTPMSSPRTVWEWLPFGWTTTKSSSTTEYFTEMYVYHDVDAVWFFLFYFVKFGLWVAF